MKNFMIILLLAIPVILSAQAPPQQEALGFITFNEGKILGLANAFTQEQYAWRPAEGVRSVGEVFAHIASTSYFMMDVAGIPIPDGVNWKSMEKDVTNKSDIINEIQNSYSFIKVQLATMTEEQLGDKVTLPYPGEYTKQTLLFLMVDHTSEHLGQLIAYARMNGVTPPWNEN
jgi:uncharacterized damage-inducible protein DinB